MLAQSVWSLSLIVVVFIVYCRHGMSYPISGLVKSFHAEGYDKSKALVVWSINNM